MYERFTILSVLIGASLTACSFEQQGLEMPGGTEASEENVGSVAAPLNPSALDIAPAAAALRGVRYTVNGVAKFRKDLYVFICDNHQLKLITKGSDGWSLFSWQPVAPDYPCDSAPTVGIIHNNEANKSDILAVYWRSDEKLMEAWYKKDGTRVVTDLKDYDPGHVPAIEGAPMVSDTSDPTKVQVVVKRSANDQVWTIAWTGSAYASLPVKRADGTIATTTGDDFYTTYNAGYGREYISVEDGAKHVIYTRPSASWGTSYTAWATVTSTVNGLLSIGGTSTTQGVACQSGFAIRVGEVGLPLASCLDAGGTLTSWWQVGIGGADNTIYAAPNAWTNWLYGYRDGAIWIYGADPLDALGTMSWNATGTASAVMQVKGGEGYVFWAKNVNGIKHLMVADYSAFSDPDDAWVLDLGGNLFY
jgi:hypothetical protein